MFKWFKWLKGLRPDFTACRSWSGTTDKKIFMWSVFRKQKYYRHSVVLFFKPFSKPGWLYEIGVAWQNQSPSAHY